MKRFLALGLAACLVALPAQAQQAGRTRGLWVTGGIGVGSSSLSCDDCDDGDLGVGPVGKLGVVVGVSSRMALAAEIDGWFKESNGLNDRFGYAALTLRYYLTPKAFLGLGAGYGRHRTGVKRGGSGGEREGVSQSGLAMRAEAGYDLALNRELVVTPFVSINRSLPADLQKEGRSLGLDATFTTIQAGLAISWNWLQPLRSAP